MSPPSEPSASAGHEWRYPVRIGARPVAQSQPPPAFEAFFDPVWLQMINLPDLSDRILSRAFGGQPVKVLPAAASTIANLRHFGVPKLRPELAPPASAPFVAFPLESKCCDLVRVRYRVAPYLIDVAFAKHLVSVRVVGPVRQAGETPLQAARRMLAVLVDESAPPETPLHLMQINTADGTDVHAPAYGCQDSSVVRFSEETPTWPDYLAWWLRPDEFGFVTSSHFERVTQGFESPFADGNSYWYTADPNAPPPRRRKGSPSAKD